jgi:hypothetical protein
MYTLTAGIWISVTTLSTLARQDDDREVPVHGRERDAPVILLDTEGLASVDQGEGKGSEGVQR